VILGQLQDYNYFSQNFFRVKNKEGQLVKFKLNRVQQHLDAKLNAQKKAIGMVRANVLKGRQQGCTTYVQSRYVHNVVTSVGMEAYILAHEKEATSNIFRMTNRYIENFPEGLCPKPDTRSANRLYFKKPFDSGYSVGTAANRNTGRSKTIQLFHGSEVAFWQHADEHAKGVIQAVPRAPGTEIILESTANGMANYFYNKWMGTAAGNTEYINIFLPWYWQEEYIAYIDGFVLNEEEINLLENFERDGLDIPHLMWRRLKISEFDPLDLKKGTIRFQQEYPMNAEEAFKNRVENILINSNTVLDARKANVDDRYAQLIIGVDPACGIKDKFTIIRRRGLRAYDLESHVNHNTMQIAGRLRTIIDRENPFKVYIDVIGIGAGVVHRLQELGYDMVEGINSARTSGEREKYFNKRAEMWGTMNDWFNGEAQVQVPDCDVLHTDLCAFYYWYRSDGRMQLSSKEELKEDGYPSTDAGDALALTFADGINAMRDEEGEVAPKQDRTKGKFF
jgi:hypothetical protein